jgi:hypothetical protein
VTVRTSKVDTYIDHEGPVAEAYKWWGVYLMREKRRLQGISEAVAGGVHLAGDTSLDDTQPAPVGIETPDELLTRVDAELGIDDALSELEAVGAAGEEESKAQGNSLRDEKTISNHPQKRKLSGAVLGRKEHKPTAEDF